MRFPVATHDPISRLKRRMTLRLGKKMGVCLICMTSLTLLLPSSSSSFFFVILTSSCSYRFPPSLSFLPLSAIRQSTDPHPVGIREDPAMAGFWSTVWTGSKMRRRRRDEIERERMRWMVGPAGRPWETLQPIAEFVIQSACFSLYISSPVSSSFCITFPERGRWRQSSIYSRVTCPLVVFFFSLSLSLPSSHISGAPSIALCRLRINKESERDWKEMERDIYISHADCIYIDSLTRPRFRMLTYETVQGGGFGERSTHTHKKTLGRRRRLVR